MKMADILPVHVRERVTHLSACGVTPANVRHAIGSGLRWGELTELRPGDIHLALSIVTVTRVVTEINPTFYPAGERFSVKPYPKSKRSRRFKLDRELVEQLNVHISRSGMATADVIFSIDLLLSESRPRLKVVEARGFTEPHSAGRCHAHGSMSGGA